MFASLGQESSYGEYRGRQQASRAAAQSQVIARQRAHDAHYDLADRLDRLNLICLAMWELLHETAGLTDDDLRAKIDEIDHRDGRRDGYQPTGCRSLRCGAAVAAGSPRCQFCGAEAPDRSPFKDV